MRKRLIPFVMAAGCAAGLLRAFEWRWAWDTEKWLMTPWHTLSITLLVFSLAVAVLTWLTLRDEPKKTFAPSAEDFARFKSLFLVDAVAVLALLVSAWLDSSVYFFPQSTGDQAAGVSQLIFAILSVLAAVCVLVVSQASARGILSRAYAIYSLVPVFWGCFWLLRNISSYAINPVPLSFLYEMLAIVFTLLAMYSSAGFFFYRANRRRTQLYGRLGIFFCLVTLLGAGFYWLFWNGLPMDTLAWSDVARFVFALFHLSALLFGDGRKRRKNTEGTGRLGPMYDPYSYPY